LTLGCMELDLALCVDEPLIPIEGSPQVEKENYEWWERSNRLSLMLIKSHIWKNIRGSIPDNDMVKTYMKAIEEKFISSDKSVANTLMKKLSSMKFDSSKSVREHIMEMWNSATKLKSLKVEISKSFLVHFILDSFPLEYGPFKISCNTHKDKWSLNELLTMCVQKRERLKHVAPKSTHMVNHNKGNWKKKKAMVSLKSIRLFKWSGMRKKMNCFFCKKLGHMKKDCLKYKNWLEKKGIFALLWIRFYWSSYQYLMDWFKFYNSHC